MEIIDIQKHVDDEERIYFILNIVQQEPKLKEYAKEIIEKKKLNIKIV